MIPFSSRNLKRLADKKMKMIIAGKPFSWLGQLETGEFR
jgi:hypothetical protein